MCMQEYCDVRSISFSLFHTHFGRENWGAVRPLQAGDRVSETLLTQQALEERTAVVGCVMGTIPHFYEPPSAEILPSFVLEGRNHYGNVWTKQIVRVNNGCCFIKGFDQGELTWGNDSVLVLWFKYSSCNCLSWSAQLMEGGRCLCGP